MNKASELKKAQNKLKTLLMNKAAIENIDFENRLLPMDLTLKAIDIEIPKIKAKIKDLGGKEN